MGSRPRTEVFVLALVVSAQPAWGRTVEERIRYVDQLLEEAGRGKYPYDLRASFGRKALDELAPLLAAAPDDPELHWLAALGWTAVSDEQGPYRTDVAASRRADDELAAVLRLAPDGGRAEDVLVERGILYSKQLRFADAVAAYERALALHALGGPYSGTDPLEPGGARTALIFGNLAESEMALGRLDAAIAHYRLAVEHTPREAQHLGSMPHWGLAVALDRDGQVEKSRAELRLALIHDPDLKELDDRNVFFVPDGEKLYYQALGHLERGRLAQAGALLRAWLATSPRRYVARGREHLDAIERARP